MEHEGETTKDSKKYKGQAIKKTRRNNLDSDIANRADKANNKTNKIYGDSNNRAWSRR